MYDNAAGSRFVNPYNFIPFGGAPQTADPAVVYAPTADLQTGWLDVELIAETPLIVPEGKPYKTTTPVPNKEPHKFYKFYTLPGGGNAVPGSTLRGMLRSVYEAASNSCLPFLRDDKPISQRTVVYGSFQDRGLLRYDPATKCWSLYSTCAAKIKTTKNVVSTGVFQGHKNGELVSFEKQGEVVRLGQGSNQGWLQFNVPIKDPYNVAVLTPRQRLYTWPAGDNDPYRNLLSALRGDGKEGNAADPNLGPRTSLLEALKKAAAQGGSVPVWYFGVQRGGQPLYYLSGASIGRVAQRRKWAEIMAGHTPCSKADALCPACLLFGTVADGGLKGRLRVTDALPAAPLNLQEHTLPVLATPRPSAFEFYLRKPEARAAYWNYDYFGTLRTVPMNGARNNSKNQREVTEYHDLPASTPRGRKMYWHSKPAPDAAPSNLNATMQAADAGSRFTFRVYFDGITPQQLRDLIWVVTLGDNDPASTRQHKLGHAKPLGYGSVKLVVRGCTLRTVQRIDGAIKMQVQQQAVPQKPTCSFAMDSAPMRSLLAMADASTTRGLPVKYPVAPDNKIYQWFAKNRTKNGLKTLPEPTDATLTLAGVQPNGGNTRGGTYSGARTAYGSKAPAPAAKQLSPGQTMKAKVINANKSGRFINLTLQPGGYKASAPANGRTIKPGTVVTVRIVRYDLQYRSYSVEIL